MKFPSTSLLFALVHYVAGTPSVQECLSDMIDELHPPLDVVEGNICNSISYNYGPSRSYCENGDYQFFMKLGFRGHGGQLVTSIFGDGEVIGMGGEGTGDAYVEIEHFFTNGPCYFNGIMVDRFIITYDHVDWTNEQYDVGAIFSTPSILGRLTKNDKCPDGLKDLTYHSLGIKLELGYGQNMRTSPISPHYLFDRPSNPLVLTAPGNMNPDEDYSISIVADKCDTDFSHMELHCYNDEGNKHYSHSLDYSTHQNTYYSPSTIHVEPHKFGGSSKQWRGDFYIPSAQTELIWSSIGFPSTFTCHLLVFDLYGNDKGFVEFYGKGGTPPTTASKSGSIKSGSIKSGSIKSGSIKSGSIKSGSIKSGSIKSGSSEKQSRRFRRFRRN